MESQWMFGVADDVQEGSKQTEEAGTGCVGQEMPSSGSGIEVATKGEAASCRAAAEAYIKLASRSQTRAQEALDGDYLALGGENEQCPNVAHKASKASARALRRIIERQGYCCAACGIALTPDSANLDHIIPKNDGGDDTVRNLQWLCKECNHAKGILSMQAFISMCIRITHHQNEIKIMDDTP